MSCNDCLIWIGQSYKTIEQYLSEAEKRGCCRKVPYWPAWAKPGETRVFLAHRGGSRIPKQGSIFSYFVLYGVDVILDSDDCKTYKRLRARYLQTRGKKKDLEPLVAFWRKKRRRRKLPVRIPDDPSTEYEDEVIDFMLDLLISCESNSKGSNRGGYSIPVHQTELESDRGCGARVDADSFYFVDELTRTIDSIFCELLKELVKETLTSDPNKGEEEYWEELRAQARSRRDKSRRQQGLPQFQEAMHKAASQVRVRVPPKLSDFADMWGALVVFKEPYPIFNREPQASFRGLLRIDGDELLEEISALNKQRAKQVTRKTGRKAACIASQVKLPYCDMKHGTRKTQVQLVAELVRELQIGKELTKKVLDRMRKGAGKPRGQLVAEIARELQISKKLTKRIFDLAG